MVTWISALSRTRQTIAGAFTKLFTKSDDKDDFSVEEVEETLLRADVPVRLAAAMIDDVQRSYKGLRVSRREMLKKMLIEALPPTAPFEWQVPNKPLTILVVGVNGSGKTTTCAKLARLAMAGRLQVLLGAADTFRAAGSDQLKLWADRVGCDVVGGATGADAAAVAYDALSAALSRNADALVIDTAGRMHTKEPLMRELAKVRGALAKKMPQAPQEVWMVMDATMGHNAVIQAQQFNATVPLTGVVITKLDGSSKAGFVFSIYKELNVPIRFIGLGEGPDDLTAFNPEQFVAGLIGDEPESQEQQQ